MLISQNEVKYAKLTTEKDTTLIRSQAFLKLFLRCDRLNLYRYNDKIKERFYVLTHPNILPEEQQFYIQKKEGGIEETTTFRQQLNAIVLQHNLFNLSQQITKLAYSRDEIARIIRQINTRNFPGSNASTPKKSSASFFIGSGINRGKVTYRGESRVTVDGMNANGFDKFKDKVETISYLPVLSVGINYAINPAVQRLVLQGELLVSPLKSNVVSYYRVSSLSKEEQENTYNLFLTTITAAPQLVYNICNTEKLKFYLAGGHGMSYYLIHKDSLTIKYPDQETPNTQITNLLKPKHLGLNILLRSGITISNLFEAGVTYINSYGLSNHSAAKAKSSKVNNLVFNFN